MNATTNFILEKTASEGANSRDVLAEARDLGCAEGEQTAFSYGHEGPWVVPAEQLLFPARHLFCPCS